MTEFIFSTLAAVGFTHPLHPAVVHIPMGMVMGCFFFGLAALFYKGDVLRTTAFHCAVLAILFIVPTIFTGYLDWQQTWGGSWNILIKIKMVLAVVLTLLLGFAIYKYREDASNKVLFIIYCLCLGSAVGLGFSGGELIYGG